MERAEAARRAAVAQVQAWLGVGKTWHGVDAELLVTAAAVAVAAAVLLAATLLFWRLLGRRHRGAGAGGGGGGGKQRPVALLGLPGAGKTALFLHLRDGTAADTHMSQCPNEAVALAQFPQGVRLIDFPGHHRVRDTWLQLVPNMSKASLVFVVNSVDFSTESSQVAECALINCISYTYGSSLTHMLFPQVSCSEYYHMKASSSSQCLFSCFATKLTLQQLYQQNRLQRSFNKNCLSFSPPLFSISL